VEVIIPTIVGLAPMLKVVDIVVNTKELRNSTVAVGYRVNVRGFRCTTVRLVVLDVLLHQVRVGMLGQVVVRPTHRAVVLVYVPV